MLPEEFEKIRIGNLASLQKWEKRRKIWPAR